MVRRIWNWRHIYSYRLNGYSEEDGIETVPIYSVGPWWAHLVRMFGARLMYAGMHMGFWAERYLPEEGEEKAEYPETRMLTK